MIFIREKYDRWIADRIFKDRFITITVIFNISYQIISKRGYRSITLIDPQKLCSSNAVEYFKHFNTYLREQLYFVQLDLEQEQLHQSSLHGPLFVLPFGDEPVRLVVHVLEFVCLVLPGKFKQKINNE